MTSIRRFRSRSSTAVSGGLTYFVPAVSPFLRPGSNAKNLYPYRTLTKLCCVHKSALLLQLRSKAANCW